MVNFKKNCQIELLIIKYDSQFFFFFLLCFDLEVYTVYLQFN